MTENVLAELHERLMGGELAVAAPIAERVLERMVRSVTAVSRGSQDQHAIIEACHDALLNYLAKPSSYDAGRSNLLTFLIGRARSRADTTARTGRRRALRESAYAQSRHVELGETTDATAFDVVLLQELLERHWHRICPTEEDAEVFLLIAAGERRYSAYLGALDLVDTPDNREKVARIRERVRGRVRRLQPALL